MARGLESDARALRLALFAATAMIAQQVAGKATRDALFLSNFDVTNLPKVVIAAAICSMAGVLLMSRLLSRIAPARLVPALFGLSALLFAGEWVLLATQQRLVSIALYLHMAVFGAILISGFWSIINERFDPHSAKQRVARIAAAAALGGVIGGLLANRVSQWMDVRSMLLFLGGLHLICMRAVRGIGAPPNPVAVDATIEARSGFAVIRNSRYLQWMAALMLSIAVVAALMDYALKAEATARYRDSEALVSFLGTFYAAVGLLGFGLQTLLGPPILKRFGIRATIAVLPAMVTAFGSLATLLPQLWSMVLVRGGHAVLTNSLFRSGFELLYTPLPPDQKRPTKGIIDVASDRAGDLLGSGLLLLLLFLMPDLPTSVITACGVCIALLALVVIVRINRGYIRQLARNLHTGVVRIEHKDIVDATTRKVLAEADTVSEKQFLESRMQAMQAPDPGDDPVGAQGDASDEIAAFAVAVRDLGSGKVGRIRQVLAGETDRLRLAPYLIPLLAEEEAAEHIRTELRWLVPRIVGQLTDALLDPDQPPLARQRIPSVLEVSHNPRAVEGLLLGLVGTPFNVRFSCARALGRMRGRSRALAIPRDRVYAAIRKELDASEKEWCSRGLQLVSDAAGNGESVNAHVSYGLQHVFSLLALVLEPEAVQLSMRAAFSEDRNLRGTALEYLENVLPADLYAVLVQRLAPEEEEEGRSRARTRRRGR